MTSSLVIALCGCALAAQGRPEGRSQGRPEGGPLRASAPAAGVRAIATVRQLHDVMISPASDAVFEASGNPPTDDKGWTAARNQALVLAEAANLLMVGSRVRDNGNWMKMSRALVDAAAVTAAAAGKKDAKALEASTDAITVACMDCHQPYRDQGRQMGVPPK